MTNERNLKMDIKYFHVKFKNIIFQIMFSKKQKIDKQPDNYSSLKLKYVQS